MENVRYRGHLKVLDGECRGKDRDLPGWLLRATESFEVWAERLPLMAAYLRENNLTAAAVAVEAAGLAAQLAARELGLASGPPLSEAS